MRWKLEQLIIYALSKELTILLKRQTNVLNFQLPEYELYRFQMGTDV